MSWPEKPHSNGGEGAGLGPEFSIAKSNALIPLLLMFGLTVLAILVAIVRAKPIVPREGAPANQAFSPADFPAVFGREDALVALEGGSGESGNLFPVPAPPFTEGIFPCMQCHESFPADSQRRALEGFHSEIVLQHDEEHRWCLDCHDANDRDHLRLASGALVPFTESYRLCGQCHGTQYRDWRSGIHGKRTGYWDGGKRYLLCVHCHNPHSPRFAALEPLPPPVRPQFLRKEDAAAAAGSKGAASGGKEEAHAGHAH